MRMPLDIRRWSPWTRVIVSCVMGLTALGTVRARMARGISVLSDTLIVNGRTPVLVGAKLLNASGRAIWRPRLEFGELPANVARAGKDGSVQCTGTGDATLAISHGAVRHDVLLRCRPIARFGFADDDLILQLGGPPGELTVDAFDADRTPIDLLRGDALIRDTSVAQLRGSLVYPRKIGRTVIEVRFFGGPRTIKVVTVERAAVVAPVSMVGGQFKSWHVEPGYYRVKLETTDSTQSQPRLVLGAINSNCAEGHSPQEYYCITTDNSAFVVRDIAGARSRTTQLGRFTAVQIPRY